MPVKKCVITQQSFTFQIGTVGFQVVALYENLQFVQLRISTVDIHMRPLKSRIFSIEQIEAEFRRRPHHVVLRPSHVKVTKVRAKKELRKRFGVHIK